MKIAFASDLIKITFENNEPFEERSLVMYGEVLQNGFAATVSTMSWLSPDKQFLSEKDKETVCNLIGAYNENNKFFIDLVEGYVCHGGRVRGIRQFRNVAVRNANGVC